MCLAIPSKVVELEEETNCAIVDTMGVKRRVGLDLIGEPVELGEYVLIHIGYAIGKIDEKEALESLKIFEELMPMNMEDGEENPNPEILSKE